MKGKTQDSLTTLLGGRERAGSSARSYLYYPWLVKQAEDQIRADQI